MHDHLHTAHDPWLVVVAIAVATYASFSAINVANLISASRGSMRAMWIAAASFCMGGGIWSMHFIAMLAYQTPAPLTFHLGLTLLSLIVAVIVTAFGFAIASRHSNARLQLVLAGVVMGLGVAAMHYMGMAAVETPAEISYDFWIVTLSVGIAVVAATVALHIALEWTTAWHQIVAAFVMGGAIASMHFTGMAAVNMTGHPGAWPDASLQDASRLTLGVMIAVGMAAILTIGLVSVLFERRVARVSAADADALQRSERRLKALLRKSSDLILLLDRDGTIIYAAAGMLGLEPGDLERWRAADLVDAADRDEFRAAVVAAVILGQAQGELRATTAAGVARTLEYSIRNALDDQDIRGLVASFHDVTARKDVEDEMRRAMQAAEQANRTKTQILTNMSHELRTPLNAIIGFSEMIASESLGPVGLRRYVDYAGHIHRGGTVLLRLLNDILDAAKLEAGEIELYEDLVDLDGVVEAAAAQAARAAAEQSVAFIPEIKSLPSIRGDSKCLRRMLEGLLDNAVKFTPQGGAVHFKARFDETEGYVFEIVDSGIGISSDMMQKVREPFIQADGSLTRKYEGAGLGLTIASAFARLHGGSLDLASELGQGTAVSVRLPVERAVISASRQVA